MDSPTSPPLPPGPLGTVRAAALPSPIPKASGAVGRGLASVIIGSSASSAGSSPPGAAGATSASNSPGDSKTAGMTTTMSTGVVVGASSIASSQTNIINLPSNTTIIGTSTNNMNVSSMANSMAGIVNSGQNSAVAGLPGQAVASAAPVVAPSAGGGGGGVGFSTLEEELKDLGQRHPAAKRFCRDPKKFCDPRNRSQFQDIINNYPLLKQFMENNS